MSHVYLIIVILKLHLESKSVVEASSLFLERILEVANVLSISVPSDTLAIITLCHLLGVDQRFHALVVRTLRFHQIHKIELVSCEFLSVLDSEVEPLCVCSGVMIVLEDQVVFILPYLDSPPQVSRLKSTLEYKCRIIFVFLLIVCLQLAVVSIDFWHFGVEIRTLP